MKSIPSIAIVGRAKDTLNYEAAARQLGIACFTTLNTEKAAGASHLLLPGGGDITPAFFGQANHGSRAIDTELDVLQFQALDAFIAAGKPVLGICKGLQLINVRFGGAINQNINTADRHKWVGRDQTHAVYHSSFGRRDFFYQLYGSSAQVNSAHHQAAEPPGEDLIPVCRAGDGVIEGLAHRLLPILAVQWHPERMLSQGGDLLFQYFWSLTAVGIPPVTAV
ncbi:MAG: gamma-glutamyl-gamma-aminobutyrate hydrolase family protein [Clostridiales bacterium]|nr:gamma-glutamyl-gamma-aminobutyrate hydrolase family protein [Clostridiales bacterium]